MTSTELTDDETRELAGKRLKELCENPCSEDIIDGSLNEEQEEWIKSKLPNDPVNIENPVNTEVSSGSEITYDEWYTKLIEKYNKLQETVKNNIPSLWDSLEFE